MLVIYSNFGNSLVTYRNLRVPLQLQGTSLIAHYVILFHCDLVLYKQPMVSVVKDSIPLHNHLEVPEKYS